MANDTKKDALSSAAARASTRNGGRNGSCPVPAPHRPSLRPVTVAQTCSARPSGPPGAGRPLSAGASFPFATWFVYHDAAVTLLAIFIGALVVWKHRGNLKRILRGEESKFSLHRKKT